LTADEERNGLLRAVGGLAGCHAKIDTTVANIAGERP